MPFRYSAVKFNAALDELVKIAEEEDPSKAPLLKRVVKHVVVPAAVSAAGYYGGQLLGAYVADKMHIPMTDRKRAFIMATAPFIGLGAGLLTHSIAKRRIEDMKKAFPEIKHEHLRDPDSE